MYSVIRQLIGTTPIFLFGLSKVHSYSYVAYVWVEQKLLGQWQKSLVFLNKISSFGTCFAEIKSFVV
jgi:hypothetical protein